MWPRERNPRHRSVSSSRPQRSCGSVEARAFIRDRVTGGALWLVGPSRGSVDDLARSVARECGATIGLHRFSVTQLAARLAAAVLADARLAPATYLGSEAVAARAVFDARRGGSLEYFGPVASTPGFPRALARTLQELRLAHVCRPRIWPRLPLGGTRPFGAAAGLRAAVHARRPRPIVRRSSQRRRLSFERVVPAPEYRCCCWTSRSNPRSNSNSSRR